MSGLPSPDDAPRPRVPLTSKVAGNSVPPVRALCALVDGKEMTTAHAIYQANLDAVSQAIMTGDLPLLRQHIAIPILLSGPTSEIVVSSVEELEIVVSDYREELIGKGFTAYRRTCIEAQVQPGQSDMIVGRHRTEIMAGRNHLLPPYECKLALMLIDGGWKAVWEQVECPRNEIEFLSRDISDAQKLAHAKLSLRAPGGPHTPPKEKS